MGFPAEEFENVCGKTLRWRHGTSAGILRVVLRREARPKKPGGTICEDAEEKEKNSLRGSGEEEGLEKHK